MTREEALKTWLPAIRLGLETSSECKAVLDMAIKALEQEPCEDAISRRAVIEGIDTYINKAQSTGTQDDFYSFAELVVKELPSVTPKGKTEWIPVSERLPEVNKEVIVTDIEVSDTYASCYLGGGYWQCDNGTYKDRIIAWTPLPKRYEPQESEDKG